MPGFGVLGGGVAAGQAEAAGREHVLARTCEKLEHNPGGATIAGFVPVAPTDVPGFLDAAEEAAHPDRCRRLSAGHAAEQKGGERIVRSRLGLVGEEGVDPAAAADR